MIEALIPYYYNKKESFETDKESSTIGTIVGLLVSWSIGIYAIYLSWKCNTKFDVSTGGKVFFSFWAWFFGLFYLIYYFIVKRTSCGF